MNMVRVYITETGKLLKDGFKDYHEANNWHDHWLDQNFPEEGMQNPSCTFEPYKPGITEEHYDYKDDMLVHQKQDGMHRIVVISNQSAMQFASDWFKKEHNISHEGFQATYDRGILNANKTDRSKLPNHIPHAD